MKDKEKVDYSNGFNNYYNGHIIKTIRTNIFIILIGT